MKKRKIFLGVLLAAAAISMTACDGPDPDEEKQNDSGDNGDSGSTVDPVVVKYTVTFDSKGGSAVASQEIEEGQKATRPANPSKASTEEFDFTFEGWYKDSACTQAFNFTSETITANITLYAKWNQQAKGGTPTETKYNVTFVANGGSAVDRQQIVEGQTATEPTAPTKEHAQAADGYICKFMGWYSDFELTQKFNFNTPINANTVLYAKWADYKTINSVEDFNAFRALTSSTENYLLTTDLDLKGVTLEGTANIFSGKFDGDGHTIKNAMYAENAANKSGVLVRELANGAEITNIKFLNCTASYQGETIGMVAGMVVGEIKFSNLEFNACVVSANNYMGFLFGRVSGGNTTVTADSVTTKNGCRASATSYGGFLIGDIAGGNSATDQNVITFTNMDIAGEMKGGNLNGSFIFGRIRNNTKVTLENSVIRDAKLQSEKNDNGLLAGGGTTNGKNCNVNIKNVAILSTSGFATLQSLGDLLQANSLASGEFLTTYDLQNVYTPNGSTISLGTAMPQTPTHNEVTPLSVDVTPAWLEDTLGLDFDNTWMTEGENDSKYRLVASSTNVKSADAKLETISVTTANAQTRYKKGTEFTADGLVVSAVYSDGVQLILSPSEYTVTSTAFDKDTAGTYTIVVTGVEKNAAGQDVTTEYEVTVAEQTGFTLDTQFTKLVYVQGEDLDFKNLLVYSNWSDDKDEKEVNTDAVTRYTVDSTAFNKNVAGDYVISIAMEGFSAQTIHVSVIDTKPYAVDNNVYINVDADATLEYEGARVNGVETFTTITNAIDYLASAKLGDVTKVIYVADGLYHEKITVPASLTNLKIVGESIENTIIDYDAVEGTMNPLNGTVYKMDCATIHVNATGFGLENITVQNSFNYIQDSSKYGDPQGFALTINADGAVLDYVHLYGNQDTLFFKSGRVYIKDSLIEGNVDFIFGENNGIAFFDNCLINAVYRGNTNNTGYVTAMKGDTGATKPTYGYVFNNCIFTGDGDDASILPENATAELYLLTHNYGGEYDVNAGSMSLGRPWGGGATVSMINCYFTDTYSTLSYTTDDKTKSRWFSMSGNSPINADFSEYGSQGDGAITETVVGGKILTADQAANYTISNVLASTNGGIKFDGTFDYATAYAKLHAMRNKVAATDLIVVLDGVVVDGETLTIAKDDSSEIIVVPAEWNAADKGCQVSIADPTVASYANGKITGLALGTTTVTFTIGSAEKTFNLEVIELPSYTVSFVTSGSEVADQVLKKYKTVDEAAAKTTKENAVFKGWFVDEDYTELYDFSTPVTGDITLYAKIVDWADMYKENIVMYFNGTEGDGVDTFLYANTDQTAATYYGLTVSGKFVYRSANSDCQWNNNIEVSFNVEKFATITLTQKAAFGVTFYMDGVEVTPTIDGTNVIYETTKAGVFKMKNTAGGNKYITCLSVTYPEVVEESTRIDFGSNGNYKEATVLDQSGATYGQIQAACNQITEGGTLVLYVKPQATIHISGNWSVGYDINGTQVKTTNAGGTDNTGLEYDYYCAEGGKIVITSLHNNNYFYYISVSYPAVIENDLVISFATGGNGYGMIDGVAMACTVTDHNGDGSAQVKNGTITLSLKAAATITIDANWGLDVIVGETVVKNTNAGGTYEGTTYTCTAEAGDLVITMGSSGSNYLKTITIDYE